MTKDQGAIDPFERRMRRQACRRRSSLGGSGLKRLRESRHSQRERWRQTHRDHIGLNELAEPDAGVKSFGKRYRPGPRLRRTQPSPAPGADAARNTSTRESRGRAGGALTVGDMLSCRRRRGRRSPPAWHLLGSPDYLRRRQRPELVPKRRRDPRCRRCHGEWYTSPPRILVPRHERRRRHRAAKPPLDGRFAHSHASRGPPHGTPSAGTAR
jgi:hypothetical protein